MMMPGAVVNKEYLVRELEERVSKNGKRYQSIKLVNKGEEIRAIIWDDNRVNCQVVVGKVVCLNGLAEAYNGQVNIKITEAKIVDKNSEDFEPQIPTMVFDIECVGKKFKELDGDEQDYLLNNLEKDEKNVEIKKEKTGLYSIFGIVCAIGMYNPNTNKGLVIAMGNPKKPMTPEKENFSYEIAETEKELLEKFWQKAIKYEKFVSYNGNGFDWPYLVVRSMANRVKVGCNMKAKAGYFIDLQDKFKQSRPFKLEFICKAMEIENQKEKGVSGLEIQRLFSKKKYQTIADYVARDAYSTAELYKVWKKLVGF